MYGATLPVSVAKSRLNELARRVHLHHERVTLTRNGAPEAVLLSPDDLESLELTLEVMADAESVANIAESLAEIARGERGASLDEVREDLRRRRIGGQ